jgi:hypothetical protein
LRYSAAALAALWAVPLLPELRGPARAAAPRQASARGPAFEPLPPPALRGAPADVAIGTDGVFWVLGESGAPSTYDPQQQSWQPFGGGIDAAAYIPFVDSNMNFSVALCFFRGAEVYKSGTPAPVPIASLWPNLPPSFQQGVDGATYINDSVGNTFYLFRHGQAALVDVWGNVDVYPLSDFAGAGWPGGSWQDGRFDFVISGKDAAYPGYAIFVRGGEYIVANLAQGLITGAPQPLSAQFGGAVLALLQQGNIQAGLFAGPVLATTAPFQLFGGPAVYTLQDSQSTTPAQAGYIAQAYSDWPSAWHPVLRQAPTGSIGALWSVTGEVPIVNDTTGWAAVPLPNNTPALAVDSGSDGAVYAITTGALYQLDAGGSSWTEAATTALALQQVSAGDANHVWVRDGQGNVYRFANGSFTRANLGVQATDVKANPDGTLWHCSAGQPNVYRYISEGPLPSEAIAVGLGVTSVQKAAGTSFGKAFFLVQQSGQNALVRYTSPYLFKTASQYSMAGPQQIAAGAASIFLFCESPASNGGWDFFVVALDVQTGAERWRYGYASNGDQYGYSPLYDAQQQLVYIFQAIGVVQALDARTGTPRWTLDLKQVTPVQPAIPVQPVLYGGAIYIAAYDDPLVAPNSSTVHLIAVDTSDAAQRAAANQPVVARWLFTYAVPGEQVGPLSPVVFEGSVYGAVWSQANQQLQLSLLQVDAITGVGSDILNTTVFGSGTNNGGGSAPVIRRLAKAPGVTVASLIVNANTAGIYGFFLDGSGSYLQYSPTALAGNPVLTNLAIFDGVVYFCDSLGNLYGLDASLNAVAGLPATFINGAVDATGITVTGDENGQAVVIAGDTTNNTLCFYSTATGNLLTLATNQTGILSVSDVRSDGILYVGGGTVNSLGQVFAIRASDVGALRDFVIESQLMQDYDAADPGVVAIARYQTHITIVDDDKTAQPFTSVKIWSDNLLTLLVDGASFNIGPDTPAATEVDASGVLALASNAGDMFATTLRIWAAFMDPHERIVIYPDREFHARLPSITSDPSNDDPTVINLATGTNYAGTQVFTDQQQAQAVASAVSTTCQAAGIGGTTAAGTEAPSGDSLPPYIAYGDLPGIQYSPYNTPAGRPAVPQSPYGLSWSSDAPATYTVLAFAAAAAAADALAGEVDPSMPAPIGSGLGSIFSDLWHKIKSGVAKVTKVVVSIGTEVYTGIQYVENGVTKVFRFVVRRIEDLAATVGAFFMALGKAIEDIIELLSLLLHFEEVVKTHKILKAAILQQINGLFLTGTTVIQPAVKAFFANGEDKIEQAFCTVKQQIVPGYPCSAPGAGTSPPVSGLAGIGATAHTIFSVAPKTGGSPKSHAVASTWGFDKVRSHYKQATTPGAATAGPTETVGNPVLDFVNSFANSLTNDPTLQQAYTATLNDFAASFAFKSSTEFLQMAVLDLLDVIQDLLISSLAIGEAFFEGLLAVAGDLVAFLLDPQQGILVKPLNIPIISDLYSALFDSQLTFLDLIVLVASIPVTFLYRIVEGEWLSEQVAGQVPWQAAGAAQATLTPLARALGLLNAAFFFGRGILMPINDTTGEPGAPNPITYYGLAVISTGFFATTMLKVARASDLVFVATSLGLIITPYFLTAAPAVACFLALVRIGAFIFDVAAKPSADALFALSGNVLGSLPALAQPLKYLNNATDDLSLLILLFLEVTGNFGAGMVDILNTMINWDAVPTGLPPSEEPSPNWPTRLHLPFVQNGP